jgi:hypothetical protein
VSDWLHLMKNAQRRLFRTKIFVNPQNLDSSTIMDGIARVFDPSATFTDDSPLGKMRDCYPLDLFTLHRALVLHERGENISEFIYLFIFG